MVGLETLTPAFHAALVPLADYLAGPGDGGHAVAGARSGRGGARRRRGGRGGGAPPRRAPRRSPHLVPAVRLLSVARRAGRAAGQPGPPRRGAHARDPPGAAGPDASIADSRGAPAAAPVALHFAQAGGGALRYELERARRQKAPELMRPLAAALGDWRDAGWRTAIACDSAGRAERLAGLLAEYGITAASIDADPFRFDAIAPGGPPALVRGRLSAGFTLPADRVAILSDDDIFGARRARRPTSARPRAAPATPCWAGWPTSRSSSPATSSSTTSTASAGTRAWSSCRWAARRSTSCTWSTTAARCTCRSTGSARSSATSAPRASSRASTSSAASPGRRRGARWRARCARSPRSCSSSTPSAPRCPATPSRPPTPCSASSRRPSRSTRRRTSRPRSTPCWPTWRRRSRWIAWSAATSATARPRWRCAPSSRPCWAASRRPCWRRPRCWSSSTSGP